MTKSITIRQLSSGQWLVKMSMPWGPNQECVTEDYGEAIAVVQLYNSNWAADLRSAPQYVQDRMKEK